jgi:ATP-dependent Lon protease
MSPLDALTELANLPPEALEQIFQEEMESSHEPMAIPLLPIRDQVYYPHMVFSLLVGRERSVRAVESASNAQRFLFLAAQSNLDAEDPTEADLYRVGIVAEIMQIMRLPDGNVRLMLEGVARYQIVSVLQQEPYYEVLVEPLESYLPPAKDIEALVRVVKGQFEQIIHSSQSLPPEILAQVMQIEDPGHLTDNIAAALKSLKIDRQQKVLECLDIRARLLLLGRLLTEEGKMLELQQNIRQRIEKEMGDSQREYMLREQIRLLQNELGERSDLNEFEELRQQVITAKMPEKVHERCFKEIDRLEKMPFAAPEGVVVRNYLDWMLALPWSTHTPDNVDLTEAMRILDSDHYGLEKIKERIIEFLAVRKLTGTIRGPILCFVGPPGVGKTSIGQSIAQALGRKFVRVSLGGVRDEAEIRGHRRTYIGAMPGRILQGMKQAGTRNPVFMLDEIDKLGMDFRGDPSSALLEALDPEQNSEFSDHYLEAPYDLSDVMFIATSNLLENIPHALRDRMEVLQFTGYTEMEKLAIAEQFLLAKQRADHGLKPNQINITSDALRTLIREYTREAGVRNLEREIANLCRKVTRKVVGEEAKRVKIDAKHIPDYLGQRKYFYGVMEEEDQIGAATGLVYTEVGGDIVTIEVSLLKGHEGRVQLTGSLGDVMKESAQTAFSFVRSCAKQWKIDEEFYRKLDVHVHVPAGAVPKDGPSAGITMATALASALTQKPVRRDIAMTGEITLRGRVLPVGGIKEKVLAAHRAGIREVLLPKENRRDLDDLPEYVRGEMKFHFVDHVEQVFHLALVTK